MRPKDRSLAKELEHELLKFDREQVKLPGIQEQDHRSVFIEQLVESIHRVKYVSVMRTRPISERCADPGDMVFDPVKAAIVNSRLGRRDEAFWMVFLFVHFGKHGKGKWRYAREVYGGLGDVRWDWARTSADPGAFREWLDNNGERLKRSGDPGGFGSHRKYESLDAYSARGTGAAVETYVRWVSPPRTHDELMAAALANAGDDPKLAFDALYKSMRAVASFGRTARFDYLAMIGKLGLAAIAPGATYMQSSTGPVAGARLLFGDTSSKQLKSTELEGRLVKLDDRLGVGMQVLEDALCNWQKSPSHFKPFRG